MSLERYRRCSLNALLLITLRISSGPHLTACWSFIKVWTIGQTDFTVCVYCEGVESDTTCSPVPVSDVTWQTTVLAADKIYQHSHASWPWPRPARRLKWHLRLTLPTNWDRNDRIWHCQPIAPRPATLTMMKTYTYARSHQAWGVQTQLERCAVSLDTAAATTQSALKYWWQRNEVRKKLATFKILSSPVTDSSKAYNTTTI